MRTFVILGVLLLSGGYDLYERNRDRANWDVRENWRYQKRAYLEGNTRIRPNNFAPRRRYPRGEYDAPRSNRGVFRPER